MINLDLSNLWGELSLPDLLAAEQEVSSAHQTLASGKGEGGDFTGWLDLPTVDETEEVQRSRTAAPRRSHRPPRAAPGGRAGRGAAHPDGGPAHPGVLGCFGRRRHRRVLLRAPGRDRAAVRPAP